MAANSNSKHGDATAGKPRRRYPLARRLHILRLLFGRSRKLSFSRRLILLARRYGVADRTLWRWVRRYRLGGVDGMRDHVRRDTLTRRAPANVASITPGAPVRLPLDAPTVRATRTSEPRP